MREHEREVNNHNHQLLNVRKLFEQRITAFLDKGSGGAINGNNLVAIGLARDTVKQVLSAVELNNKKGKLETNNDKKQDEMEVRNDIVRFTL